MTVSGTVRAPDTVSRLGGNEFTILAAELDHPEDAATLAEKLLAAFARPFAVGGHEMTVGASIGIGIFPDNADSSEDLAKAADAALALRCDYAQGYLYGRAVPQPKWSGCCARPGSCRKARPGRQEALVPVRPFGAARGQGHEWRKGFL